MGIRLMSSELLTFTVPSVLLSRPLPKIAAIPALGKNCAARRVCMRSFCSCTSVSFLSVWACLHVFTVLCDQAAAVCSKLTPDAAFFWD